MQPQDSLDVAFCDLCNTSVPLQDLQSGAAVRHQGKTIGTCCLATLRGGSPAAVAGAPPRPASGESRLLPLGIAILTAVAAATIFVDFRLQTLDERYAKAFSDLGDSVKAQGEVMTKVSVDLDGAARRGDFDALGERFAAIDTAEQKLVEQLNVTSDKLQAHAVALQQRLDTIEQRRPDYGPVLNEIRQQLQAQATAIAELKAMPRAVDAPAKPVEAPAAGAGNGGGAAGGGDPASGLPAALQHQVQKLKDEDPAARFVAVDELLRSKNAAVLEHLLPMTKDADTYVRRLTVEGLKDFKQAAVVDALLVALSDPEDIVRDTAWRSLKDLTGQKLPFEASASRDARGRAVKAWQDWWDKNKATFGS